VSNTYQRPTDEQMPAALAEVMGWESVDWKGQKTGMYSQPGKFGFPWACGIKPPLGCIGFNPMKDRNHSRLAVERCAELGLMVHYRGCLIDETQAWDGEWQYLSEKKLLLATPAQESFAAHKTLTEHRQQKGKP
jgi:hypothetical protein